MTSGSANGRWILWIGGLGLLLLVAVLVVDGIRLGLAAGKIRDGASVLRSAASALGPSPADWDEAHISTASSRQAQGAQAVSDGASTFEGDWLLRAARPVPVIGPQARAILDLVRSARAAGRAEGDLVDVARRYRRESTAGGTQPVIVLRFLKSAGPDLGDASRELSVTNDALRRDRSRQLVPPLRSAVESALRSTEPAERSARLGATAATYLPAALGADGPRTYLVLLPNPSEIRPSGGFYGALGYVTVDRGALTNVDIEDSGPFSPRINPPVPIPTPLSHYLIFNRNALDVSDSGWDPDFPTTARLAESMMKSATGRQVDGTISIDPYAIASLLSITGPVTVAPYGTFTSDDFFNRLNVLVNATPSGKSAIGPVGNAIIAKVLGQPSASLPKILEIVNSEAAGRHLEMYSHDPSLGQLLGGAHFDGALLQSLPEDDYLAIVDANVGGTKGDSYVHRSVDLKVERYSTGITRHELIATYQMPLPTDDVDRYLNKSGGGAYRDYVRFYLPEAASVHALYIYMDGKPTTANSIESLAIEHGKRVAAAFVSVPRGHSAEVHLFYEVPLNPGRSYSLLIQKQAGIPGLNGTLAVSLPGAGIRRRALTLRQDERVRFDW